MTRPMQDEWAAANPYALAGRLDHDERAEALKLLGEIPDTIGWLPVEVQALLQELVHHPKCDADRRILAALRRIDEEARS